jgi:hypothetical protein
MGEGVVTADYEDKPPAAVVRVTRLVAKAAEAAVGLG